ncbi:MAG: tryptophan--tRNA ligase [bacterium]|nr:tryptophan--tRNA ligase [bacterium]
MRILSGIQPTGPSYHIGNYLGAIRQWVDMQQEHELIVFIADLHAITVPQSPGFLSRATMEKTSELLALGIDPERTTLFVQSHIQEHAELAWILSTLTPVGELERMTQFKDKAKKHAQHINAGLLNYPVLQAADILLYKPEGVPIGKDQVQHLELSRTLARKFNNTYGETFLEPRAIVPKEGGKILSLQDPKKKMSKSDPADTQISLFDTEEQIKKKVKKAVTDMGSEITYSPSEKPGISNLLLLFSLFGNGSVKEAEEHFKNKGYAKLKKEVGDLLAEKLAPFRERKATFLKREVYVREILTRGAKQARFIASSTMQDVREKVGLLLP